MVNSFKILAINPGSTSTKIGLFENNECIFKETIEHSTLELSRFKEISDQKDFRLQMLLDTLAKNNVDLKEIDAFSGRGGSLEPCEGGTYEINDLMYESAKSMKIVKHPSALGIVLASDLASLNEKRAFCVNPPDVDEFNIEARITGIPGIYRESRIHALNQKEIAIRYAKENNCRYEDLNLIVCHIGGGISIAAHNHGKMIDCNDIVNGDGPMSPNRSGFIPAKSLVNLCYKNQYSEKEIKELINKNGGIMAWLGTNDMKEVTNMIKDGNQKAKIIYDAMIYQIAKQIGAMFVVLKCNCSAIIITGGIANDPYLVKKLNKYIEKLAKIVIMPGEFELEALASGALRVLQNLEISKEYKGIPVFKGVK
ncbi:MAG: butyrate kinase [Firmicutes bacterium]|nr:butyrate kinase [Bacillota bacterium]